MDNPNERCEIAAKDGSKAIGRPVLWAAGRVPAGGNRSYSGAAGLSSRAANGPRGLSLLWEGLGVHLSGAAIVEPNRRDFLYIMTGAVGAVGVGATVWPLIDQMNPDASTLALSSIEVDLGPIAEGQLIKVLFRGGPVFVRHRTKKEIDEAAKTPLAELKDPQKDADRVKKPEWLIVSGVCTHLGCVPLAHEGQYDGWKCPCHGSVYDTSGRIRQGPAPANLPVPDYVFLSDTKVRIG